MSKGSRLISLLALAAVGTAGCGSAPVRTSQPVAQASAVQLTLVTPGDDSVTSSSRITVRGTVSPPDAAVSIQGRRVSVHDGVFSGQARLHRGRTTVDVIATAAGAAPGGASVTVARRSPKPKPTTVRSTAVAPAPTTVLVRTAAVPAGGSCGAGVTAGANTSCAFALNVRDAYYNQGPGNVTAYSPVTDRTYTMWCGRSAPVVCTGGDAATVYIHTSVRRTVSSGRRSCGAGVSAGANTSCPFALNVRDAYYDQGQGTVTAYSPVTGRTYSMWCARSAPVVCTGGDNASVYIS